MRLCVSPHCPTRHSMTFDPRRPGLIKINVPAARASPNVVVGQCGSAAAILELSMPKTVSQKMGLKDGMRAFFSNAPASALAAMKLPELDARQTLRGEFDCLHLFTTTQAELNKAFPKLIPHLKQAGMLWVSWPKAGQLDTDLSLPHVIRIGYSHGLVESIALAVDATWSGLKFTRPKPGKTYRNSHGQLSAS